MNSLVMDRESEWDAGREKEKGTRVNAKKGVRQLNVVNGNVHDSTSLTAGAESFVVCNAHYAHFLFA